MSSSSAPFGRRSARSAGHCQQYDPTIWRLQRSARRWSAAGVESGQIEEVYLGCANQAGEDNRNVARMALLLAGLPETVAGVTVNRLCASGLNAVNQAARAIKAGEGDVFVAGGVESMSRAPYSLPKNPIGFGPSGNVTGWDTTLGWRYPNTNLEALYPLEAMGETAENIFEKSCAGELEGGEITREEQDRFALQSQERAIHAINRGHFQREIVPVRIPQRRGEAIVVDTDEHPFYRLTDEGYAVATSAEKLAKLRPAFRGDWHRHRRQFQRAERWRLRSGVDVSGESAATELATDGRVGSAVRRLASIRG